MGWKQFLVALLLLSMTGGSDLPAEKSGKTEPVEIKWHPGHYIMVSNTIEERHLSNPHFRGVQKRYYWKALEPQKDQYDFSAIRADLALLAGHGKQLVIQVQTKAFGKGQTYAPDYLRGAEYGGGVYKTSYESLNPVLWNQAVGERLQALYRALGREFDTHPNLEAVVLPETAPASNIAKVPQPGVEPYTNEKFVAAIKAEVKALKEAFPHTVVIQYTNFPPEALEALCDYYLEIGVGMGGPDVQPYSPGLTDPKRGVYRLYPKLAGRVPLGTAVQSPDYTTKRFKGPFDPTPVKELYEFGRDKLHLNYLFWFEHPKYFPEVLKMMDSADFPKDPAGGLDARMPERIRR